MRRKGDTNEWKERQDAEVVAAYRRVFSTYGGLVSVRRLYELTAFAPATRFFVSSKRAWNVARKMRDGQPAGRMRKARARMYEDIYRLAVQQRASHPGLTLREAVAAVVRQPAPEMYVSARQVAAIIDKERRRCFERRKRTLSHTE